MPLNNPVRISEDSVVLDNISNGRFRLGLALGYRKEEFDGFGIPIKQRPSRMEEGIELINKSRDDKNFSFSGERFNYESVSVNVTPKANSKAGNTNI